MSLLGGRLLHHELFSTAALQRCDPVALTHYIDVITSVHQFINRSVGQSIDGLFLFRYILELLLQLQP
jgi:hypothetical protein